VIKKGQIERIKVLIFRESRGWEVRYPFFTEQFSGARLIKNYQRNQPIDGITGATLSVRALKKLARLSLYLEQERGELVERLMPTQGISALGLTPEQELRVRTPAGLYQPDSEFISWEKLSDNAGRIRWILPQSPPAALQEKLTAQAPILPWERMLLDLHSGRLLGSWGVYLMDAVGVLLLILAPTGFFIWLQQWYRRRKSHY